MAENTDKYASLKLGNQLCFPLYAVSKEIVKRYTPLLEELDLTYTQYLVMMVLWEKKSISVKDLGGMLFLDSGTLTPVLKKLESKGYIDRKRDEKDERVLIVTITQTGDELKDRAVGIPLQIGGCVHLEPDEAKALYKVLYKILGEFEKQG